MFLSALVPVQKQSTDTPDYAVSPNMCNGSPTDFMDLNHCFNERIIDHVDPYWHGGKYRETEFLLCLFEFQSCTSCDINLKWRQSEACRM